MRKGLLLPLFFALSAVGGFAQACDNLTAGGVVIGDETGCPNPIFDPETIISDVAPSGGTGTIEYIWMSTVDDPATGTNWAPIPGSTQASYDPPPITETTYFIRCARRSGCIEYIAESNYVTKSLNCCQNVTDGGSILAAADLCSQDAAGFVVSSNLPASGGTGTLEYQWYISTSDIPFDENDPLWSPINGATQAEFTLGTTTQTIYLVRCARRAGCPDFVGKSNRAAIQILETPNPVFWVTDSNQCFNSRTADIDMTILGTDTPYQINWDQGLGTNEDPQNVGYGWYNVTVSGANGCSTVASIDIDAPDSLQLSLSGNAGCQMNSGSATAVATGLFGPFDYLWNTGAQTATLQNLDLGTYSVTVTDQNGCTNSASIDLNNAGYISVDSIFNPILCNGDSLGTIALATSGGAAPLTYDWGAANPLSVGGTLTNAPIGSYTVTITDAAGCSLEVDLEITQSAGFDVEVFTTDISCAGNADGSAYAQITGGTGPFELVWNGTVTDTLRNQTAGFKRLVVTDLSTGCSVEEIFTLQAPAPIRLTVGPNQLACDGQNTAATGVSILGGTGSYTFLWDSPNNDTTQQLSNLPTGTYTVTVTDENGCTASATADLTGAFELSLAVNESATCPESEDGILEINATGGATPYTFVWNTGALTPRLENLNPGTYSVTATDGNNCSIRRSFVLDGPSSWNISAQTTDIPCGGSTNSGAIDLTVSGGTSPYFFSWNTTGVFGANPSNLAAGNYSVQITDAAGCSVTRNYSIESQNLTCQAEILADIATFNGTQGAVFVTTNGADDLTFNWSNGAQEDTVYALSAGTYSVTVTSASGCSCSSSVQLVNKSRLEGIVWEDSNANGVREASEPRIGGELIMLEGTDSFGNQVSRTTTTFSNGLYIFEGLTAGSYFVNFPTLAGKQPTLQNVGTNDNIDSDVNQQTYFTAPYMLGNNMFLSGVDAGYINSTNNIDLGDYVWVDGNRNGVQDANEYGVAGIQINLRNSNNQVIRNTQTDYTGRYAFNNVPAGVYSIEFVLASLPPDFNFTLKDAGNNDQVDSDVDPTTGRTDLFTLTTGQSDLLDIDAGIADDCSAILSGGSIQVTSDLCGPGDPEPIVSTALPNSNGGVVEYLWLRGTSPRFNGPTDPNWTMIPNSNAPDYDPPFLTTTSYFIRCVRGEGCNYFIGESNIARLVVGNLPTALITGPLGTQCTGDAVDLEAAFAAGAATYTWSIPGGTPSQATGRNISVVWNTPGSKTVQLTVINGGCTNTTTSRFNLDNCLIGDENIEGLRAQPLDDRDIEVSWTILPQPTSATAVLEQSLNGAPWQMLKAINVEQSDKPMPCSVLDQRTISGEYRYRILWQRPEKAIEWAGETKVNIEASQNELVAYPNPARGSITISLDQVVASANWQLTDMQGIVHLSGNWESERQWLTLDIGNLPQGIYSFQLLGAESQQQTRIFVTK